MALTSPRELREDEQSDVDTLLFDAFRGLDEVRLVRALRAEGAMEVEWVIADETRPVAYAAISKLKAPLGWMCLAPVAVASDEMGQGFGQHISTHALLYAASKDQPIVVLGDVDFYEQAGFSHARACNLTTPYPASHMMLGAKGSDSPTATLIYPDAFEAVS